MRIIIALFLFGMALQLSTCSVCAKAVQPTASALVTENVLVTPDTQARLSQIEKRMKELHERALQAKEKELIIRSHIKTIETKLNVTTGALNSKKHELKKTENKIDQVQQNISKAHSDETNLTASAAFRLREIYEGQHIDFLEMLFQVDSLQSFLDRCYFQERVAELDHDLLQHLRAQAAALAQNKEQLGQQKNKLGDIVSEFARKAMAIAREKFDQEQMANRLKTQRAFYEQAEHQLAEESHRLETQIVEMDNRRDRKGMLMGSGKMSMPIIAQVTSPFGWRIHPIFGVRRFHTGVDLAGPNHSAIKAADSGTVLYTGWYGGYGKVVIVSHGRGMATLYAHLCKIAVSSGDNVAKGDVVGYEGTTGFSTGPHLHFEVRVNGKPNNPLNYLH